MDFVRSGVLWLHLAGIVVWFGAVAYFLLVLRPAARAAELERAPWYALLRSVKRRLKRVVGFSVLAIVASGLLLAWWRGFLHNPPWVYGQVGILFTVKMGVVAALIVLYLFALGVIERIRTPKLRGRTFLGVHVAALVLGGAAAYLGILISG